MPPQPNSIIAAGKDKVSEVSPPRAKMRLQKNPAKVLKSPVLPAQDVSYWEAPGDLGGRSPAGVGAGAPRCRKRGYRPPDVRTIFEPPGKDPRGKEERGEGHSFCDGIAGAWCDHCCRYILHSSLVCSGPPCSHLRATASKDHAALSRLQAGPQASGQSTGVADCKYTCHPHCRDLVTLDCHQNGKSVDPPSSLDVGDHSNNNSHPPVGPWYFQLLTKSPMATQQCRGAVCYARPMTAQGQLQWDEAVIGRHNCTTAETVW
ncbi:UNVERIFIED_CONTAM: hypothetical protein FKN15_056210 [Acipenser sinensis]